MPDLSNISTTTTTITTTTFFPFFISKTTTTITRPQVETEGMPLPQPPEGATRNVVSRRMTGKGRDWKIVSGYCGGKENATLPFLSPFFFFILFRKMCPCRAGDVCFRHIGELLACSENVRARFGRRMAIVVFGQCLLCICVERWRPGRPCRP